MKHKVLAIAIAILLLQGLVIIPTVSGQEVAVWPTDEWAVSTPEAQGMNSGELAAYMEVQAQDGFHLRSMVMVRNGYIIAEAYGPPAQQDTLVGMYSASKSFTSALIGILIGDGLLEGVETPVLSLFPDRTIANIDARKEALTVHDLLTMGAGLECTDMAPTAELGTSDMMQDTEDWVQYALDLPMVSDPGSQWYYCSAYTHLLSGIITELTGMSALDYAAEKLFAPLGITKYAWTSSPTGVSLGFSELHLTARDMAKFGLLYLNHGQWNGEQIIPADYADASLAKQIATPWNGTTYGYQFWRVEGVNLSFALGYAGSYIVIAPDKDLVVVLTGSVTEMIRPGIQAYPMLFATAGLTTADEPLAENTQAYSQLEMVIDAINNPLPETLAPMPILAEEISGLTYGLSGPNLFLNSEFVRRNAGYGGWINSVNVQTLKLTFDESDEAVLSVGFTDGDSWNVTLGLDGVYRITDGRMGQFGAVGQWLGDNTFRAELQHVDDALLYRIDFNFLPGGIDVVSYEYSTGTALTLQGFGMGR